MDFFRKWVVLTVFEIEGYQERITVVYSEIEHYIPHHQALISRH